MTPDGVCQPVRTRLAYLTNIPTPYGLGFARELARSCDLRVIFDAYSEPNRHWEFSPRELDFSYVVARGFALPYIRRRPYVEEKRYVQLRYDLIPQLRRFEPHVIVSGEMGICTLQAAIYAWLKRVPLIIRWEGTRLTEGAPDPGRRIIRHFLMRAAARFWSNGRLATDLLRTYGVAADAIDEGMIGADTSFFESETHKLLSRRDELRSQLGLSGVVCVFVGQYTTRKGIPQYLRAMHIVQRTRPGKWSAAFVGSGPLESCISDWRREHEDVPVVIERFVQQSRLPGFFAAADLFVLPTLEDNWSIASLEAIAAGLPQLFSVYNGAIGDLLLDARLGRAVDPLNVEELAASLGDCIEHPPERLPAELGRHFAEERGPRRIADRAVISMTKVLGRSANTLNS